MENITKDAPSEAESRVMIPICTDAGTRASCWRDARKLATLALQAELEARGYNVNACQGLKEYGPWPRRDSYFVEVLSRRPMPPDGEYLELGILSPVIMWEDENGTIYRSANEIRAELEAFGDD